MDWVTNKHGVEGIWSDSGSCFGQRREDGSWQTNIPIFVPRCCRECVYLDFGEMGEYGSRLSGPCCERFVWFPTRTGRCAKQKPWRAADTQPAAERGAGEA